MGPRSTEKLKTVALIAAVLALCISGAAGAAGLLGGGDVRNGSIQFNDLSKGARAKLRGSAPAGSLLVSSYGAPASSTTLVAPGGDYNLDEAEAANAELHVPIRPPLAFRATGLRVRSFDSTGAPINSQTFTLRVNGSGTALSCVANVANGGLCQDTGSVLIRPGDRVAIATKVSNADFMSVRLALTIRGA